MLSAGRVQNVPEALSSPCFGANPAARGSFSPVAMELQGSSAFVMIQQTLLLLQRPRQMDGSLPRY